MKNAGSLDTNVLLRLIMGDVPDQKTAVLELVNRAQGQLEVADLAVVEVEYALNNYYGLDRVQVASLIQKLLWHPKISANRPLFVMAFKLYLAFPKLSFPDCCLVIYAELTDTLPLWTFDRKLAGQTEQAQLV